MGLDRPALGSLFNKKHSRFSSYKSVLLNVCEAKFAAEAAPGVGRGSFVVVIHPDGSHLTLYDIEPVRRAYEKVRRKPVTKSQMNAVDALIKSLTAERGPQKEAKAAKPAERLSESTRSRDEPKHNEPIQ